MLAAPWADANLQSVPASRPRLPTSREAGVSWPISNALERLRMAMDEIRCKACNRKLAAAIGYQIIEIKCPRCGYLNRQRAASSEPMPSKELTRGHTDHSLDGRQAPSS